jgi:ABC-type multidrug transport system fused ATPase/permease subunit
MYSTVVKLFGLLTPPQQRAAYRLIGLMVIGMIFEMLGVGLVVPALALLTQPELLARWDWARDVFPAWAAADPATITVAGLLFLGLVYALKTAFLAWMTSRQMAFVYGVQADLSERLFVGYLNKPYTFHLQHNSSELIRNVVNVTNELTLTGMVAVLILVTECLVVGGVTLLLLAWEPAGTAVAALILGVMGLVLNHLTRARIRRAGAARNVHEEARIKHLQQAIGGCKELKLMGREAGALEKYAPHNAASARIGRRHATLQALPRLWLELLAVVGLLVLVTTMMLQGHPIGTLVPTLGMFAAAAFRLIPSLNRILGSIHHLRFSMPVIDTLHEELRTADSSRVAEAPAFPALRHEIRLENVSVRYPTADGAVLSGVDLRIPRGTTTGFIGESGAGKSTLVDAFLGLLPLEQGRVLSDEVDVQSNLRGWQRQIGYVAQTIYLIDDTLRRNVAFGLPDALIDEAAVHRAIAAAQLTAFVGELPLGLDTVVGERGVRLSGGQRQRIGIARALYHDPAVLVLDEATSSLDPDTEQGVMQAIDALHGQKTILIVTHRIATLKYCDSVVRLASGGAERVDRSTFGVGFDQTRSVEETRRSVDPAASAATDSHDAVAGLRGTDP